MYKLSKDFMLSNDQFTSCDLSEVLNSLKGYTIGYRDKLNLPKKATFGLEIEFANVRYDDVDIALKKEDTKYILTEEETVKEIIKKEIYGGEVVSPILKDKKEIWEELSKICSLLNDCNALSDGRCGGHVNIGSQIFDDDIEIWRNLFKLWMIYESVIFRFSYGENTLPRREILGYSNPMAYDMNDLIFMGEYKKLISKFKEEKKWAINFNKIKSFKYSKNNVFEFRVPNGTIDKIIWQNNVNFFSKLLLACRDIDSDFLDNKLNGMKIPKIKSYKGMCKYTEMDMDKALELSDLIFDNNLDKINFLKQYVKDDYSLVKKLVK